jgi:hypothetical protein
MGFKLKSKTAIKKYIAEYEKRMKQVVLNRLILIGEQFVKHSRELTTYDDQSGNLRSSIGYVVLDYGKTIKQNFETSGKGTDQDTGKNEGINFINSLKNDFLVGYALICVAGMEYAAAVESRGRDVITGSSQLAIKQLESFKNKIR